MSANLQPHPRKRDREESLAALEELWGPHPGAGEADPASAWARRALGRPPEDGDAELLVKVDARISATYGRSVRRAS
jgi:hypothetical protein